MNLPIDLIPNTDPPRFRWRQTVTTLLGNKTVEYEGTLPPPVEGAVVLLIGIAQQLAADNERLVQINKGFADRITAQSEIISKMAEKPAQQVSSVKKSKGAG